MHEAFVQNSRTTYVIWAKFHLRLSKSWKINGRKTPQSLNFLRIRDQGLSFKGPTFELCSRCTLVYLLTLCYIFFDFYISWLPKGGFLMLLVITGHLAASSSMDMLWVLLSSSAVYLWCPFTITSVIWSGEVKNNCSWVHLLIFSGFLPALCWT